MVKHGVYIYFVNLKKANLITLTALSITFVANYGTTAPANIILLLQPLLV
jgi:hypothetical protein